MEKGLGFGKIFGSVLVAWLSNIGKFTPLSMNKTVTPRVMETLMKVINT
jgi:hypothetical protein